MSSSLVASFRPEHQICVLRSYMGETRVNFYRFGTVLRFGYRQKLRETASECEDLLYPPDSLEWVERSEKRLKTVIRCGRMACKRSGVQVTYPPLHLLARSRNQP